MWRRLILLTGIALLTLSIPAAIAGDKGNKGRGSQGRQAGLTRLDDDSRRARDGDFERGRGRRDRDDDLERDRGRRERDGIFDRRGRNRDDDRDEAERRRERDKDDAERRRERGRGRDDDRVAVRDPFFNPNAAKIKHRGMDRNGDGRITRSEWRGNDVSFERQDRNGDGILSGDELRPGAKRDKNRTRIF